MNSFSLSQAHQKSRAAKPFISTLDGVLQSKREEDRIAGAEPRASKGRCGYGKYLEHRNASNLYPLAKINLGLANGLVVWYSINRVSP